MSSSAIEVELPRATYVVADGETLTVRLVDGCVVSTPLSWYPRLQHGTPAERNNWRLVGRGIGVHWPDLDEDLSVEGMLAGRASMESKASFNKWLMARKTQIKRSRRSA